MSQIRPIFLLLERRWVDLSEKLVSAYAISYTRRHPSLLLVQERVGNKRFGGTTLSCFLDAIVIHLPETAKRRH